jgi:hypothetical protein
VAEWTYQLRLCENVQKPGETRQGNVNGFSR